tara:strand:- start:4441 stop:4587 length:147 start_codon:yes stop_codon:yes gene_type:complete
MFKIVGSYKQGAFEEIDFAPNQEAAELLKREYLSAYGRDWTIVYYRID